jgi:hypothetical protein
MIRYAPETQGTDHIRGVAPRPGLGIGAPQVPGAERPDDSTGFFSGSDVIPPNVGELPMQTDTPPITW